MTNETSEWQISDNTSTDPIISAILGASSVHTTEIESDSMFKTVIVADKASRSQYDLLIEASQNNITIPHGTVCLACTGENFHGFRNRHWEAPVGNIYLSVYFTPNIKIENTGFAFTVLAAVSVIDTLETIGRLTGRAGIKWVNDILIDDSKVSGFLTHTYSENDIMTGAVIGIGLNVESAPSIEPTPFVPKAACLNDYIASIPISRKEALTKLLESIESNYNVLINNGSQKLINLYREKSIVIGRQAIIYADNPNAKSEIIAKGTIKRIGDNLELYLDSQKEPITRGRLAFI